MSLTQGMTAKKLLGYYQNKADQDAREAKARGDLVCWSASVAPSEFCVTMGIAMIYPETHAAGIGEEKVLSICWTLQQEKATTSTAVLMVE